MAQRGRPIAPLLLSDEERETLQRYARRVRIDRRLAFRARIILACSEGASNRGVARTLRTSFQTVGLWRARFVAGRLNGLLDEPRPGAPRKITDDRVEDVVRQTLETLPAGRTHWSTR